jgi:DNA-binding SARP family transcriptional activator
MAPHRQAEALEAYRRLAGQLAADLGLDPCTEVIQLHEAILRHDPALAVTGLPASHVSGPAGAGRGF